MPIIAQVSDVVHGPLVCLFDVFKVVGKSSNIEINIEYNYRYINCKISCFFEYKER